MDDNNPLPLISAAPIKMSSIALKLGSNIGANGISLSQYRFASNMWNPILPGIGSNTSMSKFQGTRLPDISGTVVAPLTWTSNTFAFTGATTGSFAANTSIPVTITYGSNTNLNTWVVTETTTPVDTTLTAFGTKVTQVTVAGAPYNVTSATGISSNVSVTVGNSVVYANTTLTPTITITKRNGRTKTGQYCQPVPVQNGTGNTNAKFGWATYSTQNTTGYVPNNVQYYNTSYPVAAYGNTVNNAGYQQYQQGAVWYSSTGLNGMFWGHGNLGPNVFPMFNSPTNWNMIPGGGNMGALGANLVGYSIGTWWYHLQSMYAYYSGGHPKISVSGGGNTTAHFIFNGYQSYVPGNYAYTNATNYYTAHPVGNYNHAGYNVAVNYGFNYTATNVPTMNTAINTPSGNTAAVTLTLGATNRTLNISKAAAYNYTNAFNV